MEKLLFGRGFPAGNPGECMEPLLGFNMLLADTNLPTVPRGNIQSIIERDTLKLLGIKLEGTKAQKQKNEKKIKGQKTVSAFKEDRSLISNG